MQDVYKNFEKYNLGKKLKVLIVFHDIIVDMINNKKLNSVVTELFIRSRKLNSLLVFFTQSYFKVPKYVRLNSTHFFIMKPNKRELQQIVLNHSLDIDFKDFMKKIYEKCTSEPYLSLINDTTLPPDNPLKSWQLIIRLRMKNCNTMLIEKLQKYQSCHQAKLVMNI